MKFLFRVDAGGNLGLGHFFRSVALADKLRERGHEILFVAQPSVFWQHKIDEGFPYKHFDLNNNSEVQIIRDNNIDIFYVDGIIEFRKERIAEIKEYACVVFYQNVSASRNLADIFILPSIHQQHDFFRDFSTETKIFQGLKYFTFNQAIASLSPITIAPQVKNVALTAGGSDPKNTLQQLYQMIDFNRFLEQTFNFYLGSDYLHRGSLPEAVHRNVQFNDYNHSSILNNDILIGAFGVSTYEFMALGIPVIAFGHQESTASAVNILAERTNALISLGVITDLSAHYLNNTIEELTSNAQLRHNLSNAAKEILDLKGVDRIVRILKESK